MRAPARQAERGDGSSFYSHTHAGLGHNINVFQEVNFTNVNVSELAANWCVGRVNKTNSSRTGRHVVGQNVMRDERKRAGAEF